MIGLIVSILVTFFLLPTLLNLFASEDDISLKNTEKSFITKSLGEFMKKSKFIIFGSTLAVLILSVIGISKLEVENSFINYFDKETEIYKGMKKLMMILVELLL